jgi:hypothetical protein
MRVRPSNSGDCEGEVENLWALRAESDEVQFSHNIVRLSHAMIIYI